MISPTYTPRLTTHPRGERRYYAMRMPNGPWECHEYDRRPPVAEEAILIGPFVSFARAMNEALNYDKAHGVKTVRREGN